MGAEWAWDEFDDADLVDLSEELQLILEHRPFRVGDFRGRKRRDFVADAIAAQLKVSPRTAFAASLVGYLLEPLERVLVEGASPDFIESRGARVAREAVDQLDPSELLSAAVGLGWSEERLVTTVGGVEKAVRAIVVSRLGDKVTAMLARWARLGYFELGSPLQRRERNQLKRVWRPPA